MTAKWRILCGWKSNWITVTIYHEQYPVRDQRRQKKNSTLVTLIHVHSMHACEWISARIILSPRQVSFLLRFRSKEHVVHASILFLNTRILRAEACAIFAPWVGNRTGGTIEIYCIEINSYSNNSAMKDKLINWYLFTRYRSFNFSKKENIEMTKIFRVILNGICILFFFFLLFEIIEYLLIYRSFVNYPFIYLQNFAIFSFQINLFLYLK